METFKIGFITVYYKEKFNAYMADLYLREIGAARMVEFDAEDEGDGYAICTPIEDLTREELRQLAKKLYDQLYEEVRNELYTGEKILSQYRKEVRYGDEDFVMHFIPMELAIKIAKGEVL